MAHAASHVAPHSTTPSGLSRGAGARIETQLMRTTAHTPPSRFTRCTRHACRFGLMLLAALLLGSCALPFLSVNSGTSIVYPSGFQWHDGAKVSAISIPTTPDLPGPTVSAAATHRVGTGPILRAAPPSSPLEEASRQAMQVLAQMTNQMQGAGWSPLFSPAQTGAYPTLALYMTLKRDNHYCFIEYSAIEISVGQASQRLDVYYA
jgi:hypothetical protein